MTPCPPHRLLLNVRPQAELATSHKCLRHEVKRLTEENQGLRAEQLPSSAPRGLEQEEGPEESLPSLVPVRGGWVLRAWWPPRWPSPSTRSKARGPCSRPGRLCRCIPLASSLDPRLKEQEHSALPAWACRERESAACATRRKRRLRAIRKIELIVSLVYKELSAGIWVWRLLTEFIRSTKTRPQAPCPPPRAMVAVP